MISPSIYERATVYNVGLTRLAALLVPDTKLPRIPIRTPVNYSYRFPEDMRNSIAPSFGVRQPVGEKIPETVSFGTPADSSLPFAQNKLPLSFFRTDGWLGPQEQL